MVIGCLMLSHLALSMQIDAVLTLLFREQPIKLRKKLLLLLHVVLAGRFARVPGMRRANATILPKHEHCRKRVEVHRLRQCLGLMIRIAGDQKRIRNPVLLDERPHA